MQRKGIAWTVSFIAKEKAEVVANCDRLNRLRFSPALPHAFTEHGAMQAANALNSPRAVEMSVTSPSKGNGPRG